MPETIQLIANGPQKSGSTLLFQCLIAMGNRPLFGSLTKDGRLKQRAIPKNLSVTRTNKRRRLYHANLPFGVWQEFYPDFSIITIIRNPRNILVSRARWRSKLHLALFGSDDLLTLLTVGHPHKGSLCDLPDYSAFLNRELTVRYESLTDKDANACAVLAAVCDYAGDAVQAVFSQLFHGPTWTGNPSKWRDHWSDAIEKAFCDLRLDVLCDTWGYPERWNG